MIPEYDAGAARGAMKLKIWMPAAEIRAAHAEEGADARHVACDVYADDDQNDYRGHEYERGDRVVLEAQDQRHCQADHELHQHGQVRGSVARMDRTEEPR